jgi:hypothetical protein
MGKFQAAAGLAGKIGELTSMSYLIVDPIRRIVASGNSPSQREEMI